MLKEKLLLRSLICLPMVFLPYSLWASESSDQWIKCTQIMDNASRLACFDTVAEHVLMRTDATPSVQDVGVAQLQIIDESSDHIGTDTSISAQAIATVKQALVLDEQGKKDEQILAGVGGSVDAYTPLSLLFDLDQNDARGTFTLRAHRPMYFLPVWHNTKNNNKPSTPTQSGPELFDDQLKHLEAKFQISFKTKAVEDLFGTRMDLWFGYTQQSHWQIYNHKWSAPFRDTDYEPEFFLTQPVKLELPFGLKLRMLGGGFVHQSNGQTDPLSRSWNRVYGMAGLEWGKLTVMPRIWWRVPEKSGKDDNPDISDYMGYGDLQVIYHHGKQTIAALARYNPVKNKGAVRLDYAFPLKGHLKGYVQYFEGYGENLMDYNFRHRSVGIGVMLNEWSGF